MKIEPRVPQQTADASRGSTSIGRFLVNSLLVVLFFVALYFVLGWTAEGVAHWMPMSWEERLGGPEPIGWFEDGMPPEVEELFEHVVEKSGSERQFDLRIIESDEINAFAAPGGYIGLTRGLIDSLGTDEELVFVMGHEIGHFEHRHLYKEMGRGLLLGVARLVLFGDSSTGDLLGSAESLDKLSYSRRQEIEADRFALRTLDAVYGEVGGAIRFFEVLSRPDWANEWLETHPLPESRMERLKELIELEGYPVGEVVPAGSPGAG